MTARTPDLTPREGDVLAAVGRRLTNAEIATEFHLSVRTVESHIASLRRKLQVDSRTQLIRSARARRGSTVQLPQNSFVGRSEQLEGVRAVLDRQRWVTVVGAAGCGKTRLALELAASDARVPIVAELDQAAAGEVAAVIATAAGLGGDGGGDLVAACAVALSEQRHLLVLDNCDRVTDDVAVVVRRLLASARSLTVLATSRSPIGVSDEAVYQLPPLSLAGERSAAAVHLFVDRARSAAPAATFSDDDVDLAVRICRRLDGLPLAVELAAARVRHLPLAELATRLERGFDALDRTGDPSRHSTLEAAFDWTWDLLDDDERSTLSRLAALPGTFDLELAEAVTTTTAGRLVLRLLDRSLVTQTATTSDPRRFRLLDSLREFVLTRTDPQVVDDVRHAHATHHDQRAARLAAGARTDDSRAAAHQAEHLSPHLGHALEWAVGRKGEPALTLARSLAVLVEQFGARIDSLDAIARAARDPDVRAAATTLELFDLGIALLYLDLDLVTDLADLALSRADGGLAALGAHLLAGSAHAYLRSGGHALAHLDEAERLATEHQQIWHLAHARQMRGIALRSPDLADEAAALAAFASAMQTFALAGDAMHVNNVRYMMAGAAAEAGLHQDRAPTWAQECARYAERHGNRHELAHALLVRARLATGGQVDPAVRVDEADLDEAAATFRAVGDLRCLTRSCLMQAEHRSGPERITLLQQALEVSRAAHDLDHQSTALHRLVHAHWQQDDPHEAATTLGALITLVGREAAESFCPPAMVAQLDRWQAAIAEGQAQAVPEDSSRERSRAASMAVRKAARTLWSSS